MIMMKFLSIRKLISSYLKNDTLLVFFFSLSILTIVFRKTFTLPFYWDTAATVIHDARVIEKFFDWRNDDILANQSPVTFGEAFINRGIDYPHTPLLQLITAVVIMATYPDHLFWIHSLGILFSALCLTVVYKLGKIALKNPSALAASVLLLFCPIFLIQTQLFYFEIPGMTFRYLAVIFLLKRKYLLFCLAGLVAFLFRFENGAIFLFMSAILLFFDKKNRQQLIWCVVFFTVIFFGWLMIHKIAAGWWLIGADFRHEVRHHQTFIEISKDLLLSQGRWVISAGLLFSLIVGIAMSKKAFASYLHKSRFFLFTVFLSVIPTVISVIFLGNTLPRYALSLYPAFFLITIVFINGTVLRKFIWIFVSVCLVVFFSQRYSCKAVNYEDCFTVFTFINKKQQAIQYLTTLDENGAICLDIYDGGIGWLEYSEFSDPVLGYVTTPLRLSTESETESYMIVHNLTSSEIFNKLKQAQSTPQRSFSEGRIIMDLYKINQCSQ